MKFRETYVSCTVRTVAVASSMVICGSVVTDAPITVTSNSIIVEDVKAGFGNSLETDFKDLSFE